MDNWDKREKNVDNTLESTDNAKKLLKLLGYEIQNEINYDEKNVVDTIKKYIENPKINKYNLNHKEIIISENRKIEKIPHLWKIIKYENKYPDEDWVIRYDNKIYYSGGVMDFEEYKNKHIHCLLFTIEAPHLKFDKFYEKEFRKNQRKKENVSIEQIKNYEERIEKYENSLYEMKEEFLKEINKKLKDN